MEVDHASYDHERYNQPHPDPQPSDHRKIELQSPLDLIYLQENLAKVALDKLNFVLPDNPSQSKPATIIPLGGPAAGQQNEAIGKGLDESVEAADPLKQEVRDLISEFLNKTWQNAQKSLSLNGIDAKDIAVPYTATLSKAPPTTKGDTTDPTNQHNKGTTSSVVREREGVDFIYTQFDPRLQHKLASLHGELEKLTAEVSRLRREAPQQAVSKNQSALETQMALDDETATAAREPPVKEGEEQRLRLKLNPVRPGWSTDLQQNYTFGSQKLLNLAGLSSPSPTLTSTEKDSSRHSNIPQQPLTSSSATTNQMPSTNPFTTQAPAFAVESFIKEPSLTETMGKAIRARDVLMEME